MPSWRPGARGRDDAWDTKRDEIRAGGDRIARRLQGGALLPRPNEPIDPAGLDEAVDVLRQSFDPNHGGFGGAPKFPPASAIEFLLRRGRGGHDVRHAARDGLRRDLRPGRRRVRALLGRRPLARPPLREDALRQRAARPRVPARLAGDRRRAVPARLLRDARLGAARDARRRGRLLVRSRRRLRGGRGQVLRVERRRAALGAGRRCGCGDRLFRRDRPAATSRARTSSRAGPGEPGWAGFDPLASLRRARASASGPASTTSG